MADKGSRFKTLMAVISNSSSSDESGEVNSLSTPSTAPVALDSTEVEQQQGKTLETHQPDIIWIAHSKIHRDQDQDRRYFDPDELLKMSRSMKKVGILDPLVVRRRPKAKDEYDLLAGEKRYRAAEIAEISPVPCRCFEVDDNIAADIKTISNLQRGDLNKWEETNAIMGMLCRNLNATSDEVISLLNRAANQKRGLTGNVVRNEEWQTVEEVFSLVGRLTPESFRKHRVPLLKLPSSVQAVLRQGKLSYTKVNEILKVKDPEQQKELLQEAEENAMSVDDIQERVKAIRQSQKDEQTTKPDLSARLKSVTSAVQKAQVWKDANKAARLEHLLMEIESLL